MHVQRMSRYTRELAIAYGFNEEHANDLMMAAPMHDIGKIGIADNILLKPGKLTADEYEVMKTHVDIGAEILSNPRSYLIELARTMALTHHEKWDGSGYPNGLAEDNIPIEGRLIAVADVFDALTSERPYKKAWPIDDAVNYIFEQSGKHFDPAIPPLLKKILPKLLEIKETFSEVD
jgi:putative two-component system response regulator